MTRTGESPARMLAHQVRPYLEPDDGKALVQVLNTVVPLVLTWYLMYRSLGVSYWITLALAVPAAGFLLRTFVLQHDLGHGALFRSRRVNDSLGAVFGVLTLIPYHYWRRIHNLHHSHFGNLDRRGPGYLTTLTVREYLALPKWRRLGYRLYRNPLLALSLGGLYYFLVQHRLWLDAPKSWRRERRSVGLTNLGILGAVALLASLVGWRAVLAVHLPTLVLFSSVAVWVFLNQHAFEDTYWEGQASWDFVRSSLDGSSYFKLPAVVQWFTANVGFHHVHHLHPKIPNYHLERCHHEVPALRDVPPVTVGEALVKTPGLALWCEERRKMVRFRDLGLGPGTSESRPTSAERGPGRASRP